MPVLRRIWWMEPVRRVTDPILTWLPLPNVNPTFVSVTGIPLSIAFWLLWPVSHAWGTVALVLVFLADMLDGAIARKYHRESRLGWWVDTVVDRLTELILFLAFPVWLWLAVANIVLTAVSIPARRNLTLNLRWLFAYYLFFVTVILPNEFWFADTYGKTVLQLLWYFLPMGLANLAPFFVQRLPWPRSPLDFGVTYRGKRVLGDHKTVRGFLAGVIVGVLTVWGQQALSGRFAGIREISLIDYATVSLWLGFAMGAGALLGDAVKSFFKRQRGIPPGGAWFPWDKVDFLIGGLAFAAPLAWPGLLWALGVVLFGSIVSLMIDHIGYGMGVRKTPW